LLKSSSLEQTGQARSSAALAYEITRIPVFGDTIHTDILAHDVLDGFDRRT
jgi:hypothetical protein